MACGPKTGPPPVSANKVLLETTKLVCLLLVYGRFHTTMAALKSCTGDWMARKA